MIKNFKQQIANGVFIHDLTDNKFKTMRISVNFVLPLDKELVSSYALIPAILTQSTKDFPSLTSLSKHLAKLYGASLDSEISVKGDTQILNVSTSGIANKFALDGENLSELLADLLCKSVFEPLENGNGGFNDENFDQEKRQLLELLEAEFSDKIRYARKRALEIMFEGSSLSIGRYGSAKSLNEVENNKLIGILRKIIKTARIEIFVSGNADFESIKNIMLKYFDFERECDTDQEVESVKNLKLKEVTEEMKLSQSKIVMGFRLDVKKDEIHQAKLMAAILGGSPISKFFLNVREKLSLCYYCGALYDHTKNFMLVQIGVETENIEKAKAAIFAEIEDMKKSNFTDSDIELTKLDLVNSYKSISDSLSNTEFWYLNRALDDDFRTPEDTIEIINKITREEIVKVANSLELDTVFLLKGVI